MDQGARSRQERQLHLADRGADRRVELDDVHADLHAIRRHVEGDRRPGRREVAIDRDVVAVPTQARATAALCDPTRYARYWEIRIPATFPLLLRGRPKRSLLLAANRTRGDSRALSRLRIMKKRESESSILPCFANAHRLVSPSRSGQRLLLRSSPHFATTRK